MKNRGALLSVAVILAVVGSVVFLSKYHNGASILVTRNNSTTATPKIHLDNTSSVANRAADATSARSNSRSNSNELLESFLSIKTRAETGNASAQRELAEIYGKCMRVNGDPDKFAQGIKAIAAQSKSIANAEALQRVGQTTIEECAVVDNGAAIPIEAYDLWLAQAAKQGDLAAQARLYMEPGKRPEGYALGTFIDHIVNSDDVAAIFDMGQLISGNQTGDGTGKYSNVAGDALSGYAWSIAACRRGLNCEIGSPIMNSICLNTGTCSASNYESFVRDYVVSAGDAALLDSKVEEVTSLLPIKIR